MSTLPEIRTILYATDLGDNMRPVFRHALSLAQRFDARITMLHVVEPIGNTGRAVLGAYLPELDVRTLEREGMRKVLDTMRQRLRAFCEEERQACQSESEIVSELEVATGYPSEVIIQIAEAHKADLIVMGSCTHPPFGRLSMGSTARKVTQHTPIPVLLVPN